MMINKIINNLRNFRLARRVMVIIILWSIFLAVIATIFLTISDYQNELQLLDVRLEQINDIELPSLTNSIWHLDQKQIETQLLGLLNFQDVAFIQLEIAGGDTLNFGTPVENNSAITKIYEVRFTQNANTYTLGRLTVVADLHNLQNRVKKRLFGNMATSFVQIFMMAGFLLLIIDRVFVRPLNKVVQYAEKLDIDHLNAPLILHQQEFSNPKDELDLVALRLNEMRLRLMDDLIQKKAMESALSKSERNYREIYNATTEAILIQDSHDGRILQVNSSMLALYGYQSESEIIGMTVDQLISNQDGYTLAAAEKMMQKAKNEGTQIFEWQARKKNNEFFWVLG